MIPFFLGGGGCFSRLSQVGKLNELLLAKDTEHLVQLNNYLSQVRRGQSIQAMKHFPCPGVVVANDALGIVWDVSGLQTA